MSSKGIVVSSVEVTPGRSLQKKVLGKGQLTARKLGQKGPRLSGRLLLPATQQGRRGKAQLGIASQGQGCGATTAF